MRRLGLLLFFILLAGLVQTAEARKLALLVGVDEYRKVPSLKCCVNDMKTLKEALMKIGFEEDNIQILTTGGSLRNLPTKEEIEQRIAKILAEAQPKDLVFFAFSGHGAQEGKTVYFCPPFVDPEDLEGTCVSITKVMEELAKCDAKFKWMVVDACRNDPSQGSKGIGAKGLQLVPSPPKGIALFQSCAEGEESWEDQESGNGYFTKNFAAALSGEADANHDGTLTLMEVCTWTTAQTKEQVMASQKKSQKPYFSGSVSDFTLTENLNVPKAKELAAEAQKAMDEKNYALAIEKYDAALALWEFDYWKRERDLAKQFLEQEKRIKEAEEKARQTARVEPKPTPAPVVAPPAVAPPAGTTLPASSRQAGERKVFTVDGIEYAFRWCPPGEFMMGRSYDSHKVKLTRGFWLLETEVTQVMWKSVMGESIASKAKQGSVYHDLRGTGPNYPMYYVSWDDCQKFCQKLSQKLGQRVQLPTEAQWEYACRAGTTGNYAGILDEMAWYGEDYTSGSHPVAQKKPNGWGLYDMHGNVWEWCSDYYDEEYYGRSPTSDPENTTTSPYRVYRGGGWNNNDGNCRSEYRYRIGPGDRHIDRGLRPLVVPED